MKITEVPHRVFLEVKEWLEPAMADLGARLKAVEQDRAQNVTRDDFDRLRDDLLAAVKEVARERVDEMIQAVELPQDGKDGKDGVDGKDGQDGQDGRDALDLEVLPSIETDKSYPRGTWSAHQGGLWRAFQKTQGMRGWECVVNGFAGEIEYELKDARTITLRLAMSDGTEKVIERKFPGLLYRGVYKAGQAYDLGDVVSCGGSVWVADQDGPGKPGQDYKGWTLAVKRGRDGRDAKSEGE
jgi:hypothetical protein